MQNVKRLLIIGAESHYGQEVIEGIHNYCLAHGRWEYHLEADNSPETVKLAEAAIKSWNVDGILACVDTDRIERLLVNSGLPAVNFSGVRPLSIPTVISDNDAAGRMIARHFLENGFRNFACFANFARTTNQRCQGFVDELARKGFDCNVFSISHHGGDECWVQILKELDTWLPSLKKPVGLMCIHDLRSREVALACRRVGLRVPDDVAIIGISNMPLICKMSTPPLSSVDVNIQQIGYEAAKLLHHLIRGGKAPAKPILIPPRGVVVRQSSDVIAIDDRETVAAVRFIRDHAHEPVSVKDLLREVPLCRRTLEQRFIKHLGRTPKAEFMRVRLSRVQNLLENMDLPVKTIVKGSGFVNYRAFMSFFRRETGQTPTQYRRNCSKFASLGNGFFHTSIK